MVCDRHGPYDTQESFLLMESFIAQSEAFLAVYGLIPNHDETPYKCKLLSPLAVPSKLRSLCAGEPKGVFRWKTLEFRWAIIID